MATWIKSTTLHEFYKHTPAGTHQLISGDSWMVVSYFLFFFSRLTEALVGGRHFCCLPSASTHAARSIMFMRPSTIADAPSLWQLAMLQRGTRSRLLSATT